VLNPKRLSNDKWTRADLTINKPFLFSEPSDGRIVYVDRNMAYYTEFPYSLFYALLEPIAIGPAIDVAIVNDARWRKLSDGTYTYYTLGEPFIAIVDTANNLTVRVGLKGKAFFLASSVTKVAIERGWKHVSDPSKDQGIVVAYIKNGNCYCKEYIETTSGRFEWTAETLIYQGCKEVSIDRTVDYRVCFSITPSIGSSKLLLSDRMFPGVAVEAETVSAKLNALSPEVVVSVQHMKVTRIENKETVSPVLNCIDTANTSLIKPGDTITYSSAYNEDGKAIFLYCAGGYISDKYAENVLSTISIQDEYGTVWPVLGVENSFPNTKIITDIDNAYGTITVTINNTLENNSGQPIGKSECSFVPINLKPVPPDQPLPVEAHNTDMEVL